MTRTARIMVLVVNDLSTHATSGQFSAVVLCSCHLVAEAAGSIFCISWKAVSVLQKVWHSMLVPSQRRYCRDMGSEVQPVKWQLLLKTSGKLHALQTVLSLGLQVYKQILILGPKYISRTYFGPFGAQGFQIFKKSHMLRAKTLLA